MLHVSLKKGDYVMIGDEIKVGYSQNDGKMVVIFGIDAPRDLKITRSKVYEENLANLAQAGDKEAIEKLEQVQQENETRRKIFNKRMSKRQYQGGLRSKTANSK